MIMKRISIFFLLLLMAVSVQAHYSSVNRLQPDTPAVTGVPRLKIGIGRYSPPFAMESSPSVLYGFDITLTQYLCKALNRTCQLIPLRFTQLLTAVENNEIDMAIGAITITSERSQQVNFTTAYFPSQSHFIGPSQLASQPFTLELLGNKKFGIEAGSIFSKQIEELGIKNPKLNIFESEDNLIEALSAGDVDVALMDAPTARYWENHSADKLKVIGPQFPFGFGYGIAVNKNNLILLQALNKKIHEFQQSHAFKDAYKMYFEEF